MKKKSLVEQAKELTAQHPKRNMDNLLKDEDVIDLLLAYIRGELSNKSLVIIFKKLGFKESRTNGVSILAGRVLGLAKRGLIKITKV